VIEVRRYRNGVHESETVALDQVAAAIDADKGLVWIDCDQPDEDEISDIAEQVGIDRQASEDLLHANQRTKLERYHDHFHVALWDAELRADGLVTQEIDVVFGDGWIASVRQRPRARIPERAHTAAQRARPPGQFPIEAVARRFDLTRLDDDATDEGMLLWALLDVAVDRYLDLADSIDERLDEVEDIVFEGTSEGATHREVFDLRRDLVTARRIIAPLREVLSELLRREAPCVGETARSRLQDVLDHVLRATDLIEAQRELLTGLLEANLAVASNRMNDVMKRMTSWGAILLGSTLIAGIYGMNFQHMPELDWYFGYPMALGMMLTFTVVLYQYFKRRDWL